MSVPTNRQDNKERKGEINTLKKELKKVTNILGPIQARKLAKSLLNQFYFLLTKEEKQTIENNSKMRWPIIQERIEKFFKQYEINPKYDLFIEIIRKSAELIERGNDGAHSVNIDLYEKEIYKIAAKQKILIPNSDITKLFFLYQLGISDEKKREECYKDIIKTCDPKLFVSIIKTIYTRRQQRISEGKKSTASDEKYFQMAEEKLYGELAIVLDIEKASVKDYIFKNVNI